MNAYRRPSQRLSLFVWASTVHLRIIERAVVVVDVIHVLNFNILTWTIITKILIHTILLLCIIFSTHPHLNPYKMAFFGLVLLSESSIDLTTADLCPFLD